MFIEEQHLLSVHLADWVEAIEHFGSTAIDRMVAKRGTNPVGLFQSEK
ncbi:MULTISPECIES: hypothetical protein [Brevibacillus]|nr:hypothetical protein [Brevibacillus sp. RS1.1]